MSGLGASLITFVPNETAKSGDVNSNFANLNAAAMPTFTTVHVTGASSLDNGAVTTDGAGNVTASSVTASTVTATNTFTGAGISITTGGGTTTMQTQPTNDPLVVLINGHSFQFNTDGSITIHGALSVDNNAVHTDGAGNLTVSSYHGPISIDVENGETVIRSSPTTTPLIIQVNGYNWIFELDGSLRSPSGTFYR